MAKKTTVQTAADLKPSENNPRRIDDATALALAKSMARFGDLSGIVFNRVSGRLVGGHQRTKQIPRTAKITLVKEYAKPTKTGTVSEGFVEFNGDRFTYREVKWDSKKESAAATIAANKHRGEWDYSELIPQLEELQIQGFPMELTGFSSVDLDALLGSLEMPHRPDSDPTDEWAGMPAFDNEDQSPHRRIIVNFASQEDFVGFQKLIGQTMTDKTRSIWYPKADILSVAGKRYATK
jgi:hypothetical protein